MAQQNTRPQPEQEQHQVAVDPDRIQHLDPHTLLVDVNVRLSTSVDREFVASLRQHGVLQPVTGVLSTGGQVRVRFGHRRVLGAIEAKLSTVPVRVVADDSTTDADQIDRILRQMAENDDRSGLGVTDRVVAVQQLAAFGLSAAQIARRTRRPRPQVDAALTIAGSQIAQAAAARFDFLDLTQAAAVAEFEDDPETVKALVAAASTGQFDHVAQRARDDRAEATRREAVAAPLRAAGITVLDRKKDPEQMRTFRKLGSLVDPQTREELTVETHAQCPGHAAIVSEEWVSTEAMDAAGAETENSDDVDQDDPDGITRDDEDQVDEDDEYDEDEGGRYELVAVFGCVNPRHHGHAFSWERHDAMAGAVQSPLTPEEQEAAEQARKEAASAERRDVLSSNKAWRSAETVRRRWLTEFVSRKTAPKGASAFLAVAQARDPEVLADVKGNHYAAELMGLPKPSYGHSSDVADAIVSAPSARVQLLHMVLTLAAYEARTQITDWRRNSFATRRYLSYLEKIGYRLSPVEERALGRRDTLADGTGSPAPDADPEG